MKSLNQIHIESHVDLITDPAKIWRTGKVFTQAPGFGEGVELEELRIIDIRPNEPNKQALTRQGFDPKQSRIQIID